MIPVCAQRSGQHRYVPEHALERLIQDIAHLVLEILARHQRIEQVYAEFALHRFNLAARASDVRVRVERLPQVVQRVAAGPRADVEQDAHVRVQRLAECVEEPPVRVQLALVPLLEAEDHLAWHDALLGALELEVGVEAHLRRVLVHVRLHGLVVDVVLGDAVLVHAHGRQRVERARVDLLPPVRHDAHDDLLPAGLAPGARLVAAAEVADVLHHRVHGPREAVLVLVVHGDADEQLRLARGAADVLAQLVAPVDEVVRVACDGCVPHVRELDLVAARQERVQDGRDLALQDQFAVDQLHLLLAHQRLPNTAALLLALGRGAVVLDFGARDGGVLLIELCVVVVVLFIVEGYS